MPEVTSIGGTAFKGCEKLPSISLPKLTQLVGSATFNDCKNLTEVDFPLLEEIGDYTYYGCASLKEVNMPKLKILQMDTFTGCKSLEKLSLPSLEQVRYDSCVSCESLKEADFPNVTKFAMDAFRNTPKLESLKLTTNNNITTYVMHGVGYPIKYNEKCTLTLNKNKKNGGPSTESVDKDGKWGGYSWPKIIYVIN